MYNTIGMPFPDEKSTDLKLFFILLVKKGILSNGTELHELIYG